VVAEGPVPSNNILTARAPQAELGESGRSRCSPRMQPDAVDSRRNVLRDPIQNRGEFLQKGGSEAALSHMETAHPALEMRRICEDYHRGAMQKPKMTAASTGTSTLGK
jgi:hypothetical protein